MFDLNPLAHSDAWWQHLIMLLGAGILGFVIGYRKSRRIIENLEGDLTHITTQLDEYRNAPPDQSVTTRTTGFSETATAVEVAPAAVAAIPETPDDLKKIEGIGPKIEQLLHQENILTYEQLSQTSPEIIVALLRKAGPRFQMHDPASWPRQASLAANQQWEELQSLQVGLKRGRTN